MQTSVFFTSETIYNFNVGFPNYKTDILLSLGLWQYWWWFWFAVLWSMYYLVTMKLVKARVFKMHARMNTSLRAHGKWGDFLVAVLPLTWCSSILLNSTQILRMLEWQSELNVLILRIHGKQWYWVYKLDQRNIVSVRGVARNMGRNHWTARTPDDYSLGNAYIHEPTQKVYVEWLKSYKKKVKAKNLGFSAASNYYGNTIVRKKVSDMKTRFSFKNFEKIRKLFFIELDFFLPVAPVNNRDFKDYYFKLCTILRKPYPAVSYFGKIQFDLSRQLSLFYTNKFIQSLQLFRGNSLTGSNSFKRFNFYTFLYVYKRKKLILDIQSTLQQGSLPTENLPKALDDLRHVYSTAYAFDSRANFWTAGVTGRAPLKEKPASFPVKYPQIFKKPYSQHYFSDIIDDTWDVVSRTLESDPVTPMRLMKPIITSLNFTQTDNTLTVRLFDVNDNFFLKYMTDNEEFWLMYARAQHRYSPAKGYEKDMEKIKPLYVNPTVHSRLVWDKDYYNFRSESLDKENPDAFTRALWAEWNLGWPGYTRTKDATDSLPLNLHKVVMRGRKRSEMLPLSMSSRLLRVRRTLIIPAHVNIGIVTNSYDVVHSWFIPGLGIKLDCVPGRSTHHTLYVDNAGHYYGQCAEICGRYHHHMPIRVCALPFEHFLVWWHRKGLALLLKPIVKKNLSETEKIRLLKKYRRIALTRHAW